MAVLGKQSLQYSFNVTSNVCHGASYHIYLFTSYLSLTLNSNKIQLHLQLFLYQNVKS